MLSLFFSALQVLKHKGVKSVLTLGSSGLLHSTTCNDLVCCSVKCEMLFLYTEYCDKRLQLCDD